MTDGTFRVPEPANEPVRGYAPGSPERASLEARIAAMSKERIDAPCVIDGEEVRSGETFVVRAPHRHDLELAEVHAATRDDVQRAVDAAVAAQRDWAAMRFEDRAAVFLRAADLLAGEQRDTINAATILGQSKSVHQAEIDAACELIDFLRFNVHYAERLYEEQPRSAPGEWNRLDHRPLEGFVLAITPFNFTAIAGNLPTAPAMLGNTVVWKPSEKQALAAHHTMEVLRAAGLPDGVINLVHGSGALAAEVATASPHLAGLHFTGSSTVLQSLWRGIGERIGTYRTFPRIVGESGGKDFVLAHPRRPSTGWSSRSDAARSSTRARSARPRRGPTCRRSLWPQVRDGIADLAGELTMGDVGADLSTFMGAVISEDAFRKHADAIDEARAGGAEVLVGGDPDDTDGWFVPPTVLVQDDPRARTMTEELFGPILSVHVYDDADWAAILPEVDQATAYALTGSVFADDRQAITEASTALRQAAGNFYVNDKPTGPSSAGSRSGAHAGRAPTTRPARSSTCCAGSPPGRSRRPPWPRPTGGTRTRADPAQPVILVDRPHDAVDGTRGGRRGRGDPHDAPPAGGGVRRAGRSVLLPPLGGRGTAPARRRGRLARTGRRVPPRRRGLAVAVA
jgi:1-pyrroline-5-carboxylate dehydrogenase